MVSNMPESPETKTTHGETEKAAEGICQLLLRRLVGFHEARIASLVRKHVTILTDKDYSACERDDSMERLTSAYKILNDDNSSTEQARLHFRKRENIRVQNINAAAEISSSDPLQAEESPMSAEPLACTLVKLFGCLDQLAHQLGSRDSAEELQAVDSWDRESDHEEIDHQPFPVVEQPRKLRHNEPMFTGTSKPRFCGADNPPSEQAKGVSFDLRTKVNFAIRLDFINSDDPTEPTDYYAKPTIALLSRVGDVDKRFGELYLTDEGWETWKDLQEPLNYRIIEAALDSKRRWRFVRFRDDLDHGSRIHDVLSTVEGFEGRLSIERAEIKASLNELSTNLQALKEGFIKCVLSQKKFKRDHEAEYNSCQKRQRQE